MSALRAELRRHPLLWRLASIAAAAALGAALPDLLALAHRVMP